ncbi:MAG: hypothetical protein PHY34_06145 [Patescibacteria group bacterium]|nr:hypothetical protein [Patescibacteria group bacterium]MDD5715777.1 hypothetical protein [Patescibacteria group bacterium]
MKMHATSIKEEFMRDVFWFTIACETDDGKKKSTIYVLASAEYLWDYFRTNEITTELLDKWKLEVSQKWQKLGDLVFNKSDQYDIYATSITGYFNGLKFFQRDQIDTLIDEKEINVQGTRYKIQVFPSPKVGDHIDLYYFITNVEDNEVQFGFTIGVSGTLIASWMKYDKPNELIDEMVSLALEKIKLEITKGNKSDGYIYIFTSSQVEPTPEKTREKLNQEQFYMTDKGIRRKILQLAYKRWQKDPHGLLLKEEINAQVDNVPPEAIDRNIKYLNEGGYLTNVSEDMSGYTAAQISKTGVDIIEDPERFDSLIPSTVIYNTTNVAGNVGMTVVGNQNSFINSNVNVVFTEIENDILNKPDFGDIEKTTLLREIKLLKLELNKPTPSPRDVKSILGRLKEMSTWIHEKIIKHPLIAQLLVQVLIKGLEQKS